MAITYRDLELESLSADKLLFYLIWICLIFILGTIAIIGFSITKLPPQIPLFYSMTWGDPILAPSVYIWILPIISIVIFFLNAILGLFTFKKDRFLRLTLLLASFFICFSNLWATFQLVNLLV